jgi:ATP-dependent Lon protease
VVKYTDCSEYYEAEAVALGDTMGERVEAKALARSVTNEFESYVKLNKRMPPEAVGVVQQIEDYAKLADTVASHLALKIPEHLGRHPLVEFHARFSTCSTEISLSISPSTLAVARKTAAMRWNVASDVILASCGASTGCPRIGRGD